MLDEATGKWGIRVNRVELKAVDPPASIQEAMEKQMRAERDRRAAILQAEGIKQSQILTAEGEKQSAILRAEGQRESQKLYAEGQAKAIETVFAAIHAGDAGPEAARLPVPADAAADRPGRREQGVDHPERDHAGDRESRRSRGAWRAATPCASGRRSDDSPSRRSRAGPRRSRVAAGRRETPACSAADPAWTGWRPSARWRPCPAAREPAWRAQAIA